MAHLLFPPDHVQADLRLLTDIREKRSRYQIEVYSMPTHELLAMRSRPFHNNCSIDDALVHASGWLRSACFDLGISEPF